MRLSAACRIGDIHAKICDDEFELWTTKSQFSPVSNSSETSENPERSGSPGCEPTTGKIWFGKSDGSAAGVGEESGAETTNVVVGSSGDVTDVTTVEVLGVDATAREVSVTNVN